LHSKKRTLANPNRAYSPSLADACTQKFQASIEWLTTMYPRFEVSFKLPSISHTRCSALSTLNKETKPSSQQSRDWGPQFFFSLFPFLWDWQAPGESVHSLSSGDHQLERNWCSIFPSKSRLVQKIREPRQSLYQNQTPGIYGTRPIETLIYAMQQAFPCFCLSWSLCYPSALMDLSYPRTWKPQTLSPKH